MPMLDLVKSFLRSALTRLSGRKKRQQQLVRVHLEGGDEGATRRSLLTGGFALAGGAALASTDANAPDLTGAHRPLARREGSTVGTEGRRANTAEGRTSCSQMQRQRYLGGAETASEKREGASKR